MNALEQARSTAERLASGDERELARMLDGIAICQGCEADLALVAFDGEQLCVACAHELGRMFDHALRVRCAYCDRLAAHEFIALAIPVCCSHSQEAEDAAADLRLTRARWSFRTSRWRASSNSTQSAQERAG